VKSAVPDAADTHFLKVLNMCGSRNNFVSLSIKRKEKKRRENKRK
jgi:hypothetical protein